MANNKITTTALDFDAIKASLKLYLSGQAQFSDYDFEGSGLAILLDVLAYNTHYNALYSNLAINEAFLDSASKRASVVSKAKELGYVPKSASGAVAILSLTVYVPPSNTDTTWTIPANTLFTSQVDGVNYTFYTQSDYTAIKDSNIFTYDNVQIKEGLSLTYNYEVGEGEVYIIPNPNVDLSTLKVTVQESAGSSAFDIYTRAETVMNIDGDSLIYYIKELDNGLYQIEFGDGIIGKALDTGNYITIEYQACSGTLPNGAYKFTLADDNLPTGATLSSVVTNRAIGGAFAESIESVRWTAPRHYAAQNRCVTIDDYKTIIKSEFPNAHAVSVWGGEDNIPAYYGKVFISIVPQTSEILTDAEKQYVLTEIVNPRKPVTITPEIIDPEYLRLDLDVTFYYNPRLTTRSANDIETLIRQSIADYNDNTLNDFGSVFKFSKFSRMIDDCEPAITSNITTVTLHKIIDVIYQVSSGYTVDINNPIYNSGVAEQSILSNGIYVPEVSGKVCYIDDIPSSDGRTGVLRLFYKDTTGKKFTVKNVGEVQYNTGAIQIDGLNILSTVETDFRLIIKPASNDVVSYQHQFAIITDDMIKVSSVVDNPTDYIFTKSRT